MGRCYIQAVFTVPDGEELEATNSGGTTTVTVPAASYYLTGPGAPAMANFITALQAALNADNPDGWTVSLSQDGFVTIDCSDEPWALSMSTNLKSLLGFSSDITTRTTPRTGDVQARGFWSPGTIPMGPLTLPHDTQPEVTDQVQVRTPQGVTITHVGNTMTAHHELHWTHVSKERTWKATPATTDPKSLQQFMRDTQWKMGHAWFSAGAKVCILAHDDTFVGGSTCSGWYLHSARSMNDVARRRNETWDGVWTVRFPHLSGAG